MGPVNGSTGEFEDPWNPTEEELRRWAYSADSAPDQDWELVLDCHAELIVELVDDRHVDPIHRRFLLGALYVMVGDTTRTSHARLPD